MLVIVIEPFPLRPDCSSAPLGFGFTEATSNDRGAAGLSDWAGWATARIWDARSIAASLYMRTLRARTWMLDLKLALEVGRVIGLGRMGCDDPFGNPDGRMLSARTRQAAEVLANGRLGIL